MQWTGGGSVGKGKEVVETMSRAGIAAVLSFFIPGVGQIYNGDILRGLFWLIVTPGFWLGTGGCLGWVCHIIAAATAYSRAEEKEKGVRVRVV
jgi:TM2 domain-containing membrane protein YozV